jgi:hypothetical protein
MGPEGASGFFAASAGASATLIGLLFVAIAVEPGSIVGEDASPETASRASSAFVALSNVFFVSLAGTVPPVNVGLVGAILAVVGLLDTAAFGSNLWKEGALGRGPRRRRGTGAGLVLASLLTYAFELWYSARLLAEPQEPGRLYGLVYVLFFLYGVALGRAWELLGPRERGLLRRRPNDDGPTGAGEEDGDETGR